MPSSAQWRYFIWHLNLSASTVHDNCILTIYLNYGCSMLLRSWQFLHRFGHVFTFDLVERQIILHWHNTVWFGTQVEILRWHVHDRSNIFIIIFLLYNKWHSFCRPKFKEIDCIIVFICRRIELICRSIEIWCELGIANELTFWTHVLRALISRKM